MINILDRGWRGIDETRHPRRIRLGHGQWTVDASAAFSRAVFRLQSRGLVPVQEVHTGCPTSARLEFSHTPEVLSPTASGTDDQLSQLMIPEMRQSRNEVVPRFLI